MRTLPAGMIRVLTPFAPLFSERVFEHVQVLVTGAVLTPGKRTVSSALRRRPITFITRLRLDAALYEPAPPRKPGQIGRPRLKGERLPNLSIVLEDPKTAWTPITVSGWYGGAQRSVEIASETAAWCSTGPPAVPIRWVLIHDPREEFESQALLCTDLWADPGRIISWLVRCWQMESTFQEVRQRLGFETGRHWSETAVKRTAPAHLALETETVKVPRGLIERLTDAVCYAA